MSTNQTDKRIVRHRRIRSKISGTAECPRLAVFRSNKFMYAQIIDDKKAETIVSSDTKKSKAKTPVEQAAEVGEEIAKLAKEKKITKVVFDRGGFAFAGAVKALADSAREGGLTF